MKAKIEEKIEKKIEENEKPKVEICCMCGYEIGVLTPQYLREKGLCSYRCWSELYGEEPE